MDSACISLLKNRLGALGIVVALASAPVARPADECRQCHQRLGGRQAELVSQFDISVHREAGLQCSSCHGGDPAARDAEGAKRGAAGFSGRPRHRDIPRLCGSCHSSISYMRRFSPSNRTDQVEQYLTSKHGGMNARGDRNVATCTSCHSVHDIRRVKDPRSPANRLNLADTCGKCHSNPALMQRYGLPHDQVLRYKASAHAAAILRGRGGEAPTCSDCHGTHGAAMPAVGSSLKMCSSCHEREQELYDRSRHATSFAARGIDACLGCHETHSADSGRLIMERGAAGCSACHPSGPYLDAALRWSSQFRVAKQSIESSSRFLQEAAEGGLDVGEARHRVLLAAQALERSRYAIHSIDDRGITAVITEAGELSQSSYEEVVRLAKKRNLRTNLLYASLSILALSSFGIALQVRRRAADRRREAALRKMEQEHVTRSRDRLAQLGEISAGVAHSIRNPLHFVDAAMYGAHISTVPYNVLEQLIRHPLTDIGIQKFLKDWEKVPK